MQLSVAPGLALIFDLDGVIVHSTPIHNRAWEIYLGRLGVAANGIQERMHGKRNDEIVPAFLGDSLSREEILRHGAAKEALYREMMAPVLEEWLVPGVRDFLTAVAGVPLGLASNAERPNIDFVLDQAGLRPYFRAVVDGQMVVRPKPAPDIYLKAAELLGTRPENCLVFEDSAAGVEAASSAGMRVAGIATSLEEIHRAELMARDFFDPKLRTWVEAQHPR